MKVFVSEFVVGGGWTGAPAPPGLVREGYAMWVAMLTDFARLNGCQVLTTRDHRQESPAIPQVEEYVVRGPKEEAGSFIECAQRADAVLIIAPELDDELSRRVERVSLAAPRATLLNADGDTTRLCSDKLQLAGFLAESGIDTPACRPVDSDAEKSHHPCPFSFPVVVKPRFGAGSIDVRLVRDLPVWKETSVATGVTPTSQLIVQPFIAGQPVSMAAIRSPGQDHWERLPLAAQRLTDDGRFAYRGGCLPVPGDEAAVGRIIDHVMSLLPGLIGHIGFDLVIPHDGPHQPVLIEINPRLTTSYLGYRTLARDNLARRLLGQQSGSDSIRWNAGRVSYGTDGNVQHSLAGLDNA